MTDVVAAPTHTRTRILEAALDLFYRQGFLGTSVREITFACGITPGALYNHFPSKEDLLFNLVLSATDEGERQLVESMKAAPATPQDQLYALMYASSLWNIRHRPAALVAAIDYVHLPEEQKAIVIQRRRQLRERLVAILTDGHAQGVFHFPEGGGKNATKVVATALANIAMRASELFGPQPGGSDEELAAFQARLALQTVAFTRPTAGSRRKLKAAP